MPVAKSYEHFKIISAPFKVNGRDYVTIEADCPRCDGSGKYSYNQVYGDTCMKCWGSGIMKMDVRWYSEKERERMDNATKIRAENRRKKALKDIEYKNGPEYNGFGDSNGYIIMLVGNSYAVKEQLKENGCKYSSIFGWYKPYNCDYEVPADFNLEEIKIYWNTVSKDDSILEAAELRLIVDKFTRKPSLSTYQGEIGEHIDIQATVVNTRCLDGDYGIVYLYIFEDEDKNVYVWNSSNDKNLKIGARLQLTGRVKAHKEYNGIQQTILNYCKVK